MGLNPALSTIFFFQFFFCLFLGVFFSNLRWFWVKSSPQHPSPPFYYCTSSTIPNLATNQSVPPTTNGTPSRFFFFFFGIFTIASILHTHPSRPLPRTVVTSPYSTPPPPPRFFFLNFTKKNQFVVHIHPDCPRPRISNLCSHPP